MNREKSRNPPTLQCPGKLRISTSMQTVVNRFNPFPSSGGLSFHRRIPFANMSSVPATQPIPVITLVNPIPPHPASARELTAMTEHLKAIVIRPVEEVEVPLENVTVEDIKLETRSPGTETSELPPLPVEQSSENIATNEPELSENCVEQPENLAFVADHSKPPCALVTTLETRASAIARQPSPPIKSPASIRSFNWVEDADAEVDWEVEEIEVHAHHSESDLEEGEIRE